MMMVVNIWSPLASYTVSLWVCLQLTLASECYVTLRWKKGVWVDMPVELHVVVVANPQQNFLGCNVRGLVERREREILHVRWGASVAFTFLLIWQQTLLPKAASFTKKVQVGKGYLLVSLVMCQLLSPRNSCSLRKTFDLLIHVFGTGERIIFFFLRPVLCSLHLPWNVPEYADVADQQLSQTVINANHDCLTCRILLSQAALSPMSVCSFKCPLYLASPGLRPARLLSSPCEPELLARGLGTISFILSVIPWEKPALQFV